MKNIGSYLMIGALGALITGCATISNQTTQSVALTASNGKSVVATINGEKVSLPTEVEISRVDGAVVQVLTQDNKCYESRSLLSRAKTGSVVGFGVISSSVGRQDLRQMP